MSLRSTETMQKEFALQATETVLINLELQKFAGLTECNYRSRLEDMALFANALREIAPENSTVVLHHMPRVIFSLEMDDYGVAVHMSDSSWRFLVNGTPHYELEDVDKFGPTRSLKKLWDVTIPKLPDGFIIRGIVDPSDPPEEARIRNIGRKKLGFSDPQPNNEVYGIVRSGALQPLLLDEFLSLTKLVPTQLTQPFSARKVDWPGA